MRREKLPLTPCVEPIAGEEHREEEYDVRVRAQCDPEALKLCLPRRMLRHGHPRAIRPDHLAGINHQQRYEHTDAGQDNESNLYNGVGFKWSIIRQRNKSIR